MFFAKRDEFHPYCHAAIFGTFTPAGHRKTPPPSKRLFIPDGHQPSGEKTFLK